MASDGEAPDATPPADGTAPPSGSRRTSWIALGVAAVVAALFVILAIAKPDRGEGTGARRVDFAAPAVVTQTIDAVPFDLAQHRGRWVVFNFFASWCGPCKLEHPELVTFASQQAQLGGAGAELYAVINDDSVDNVRRFFADNGGSWPVLRDDDGAIAVGFGQTKPPETWVVDPAGVVRLRVIGAVNGTQLSQWLQELRDGAAVG